MWMPPKEPGGRLSPVSRRKERDSDRSSDVAIGVAAASDRVRAHGQQTAVGDGHAMSVAAEGLQHVLRSAKGGLGVDYPFLVFERRQVVGKSGRVG